MNERTSARDTTKSARRSSVAGTLGGLGVSRCVAAVVDASVLAQVLARGVVCFVFGLASLDALRGGRLALAVAAAAGGALLVTLPRLHTDRARAQFAPERYRKMFLAGATSAVSCALLAGLGALESARHGYTLAELGFVAVALGLLGAAVGVVRMRAWGVFLAGLTTTVLLASAGATTVCRGPLLLMAVPGALLTLPVLLARLRLAREDRGVAAGARGVASLSPPTRIVEEASVEEIDGAPARATTEAAGSR